MLTGRQCQESPGVWQELEHGNRVENTLSFPSSSSPLSHSFFLSVTLSQQPGPKEDRDMLLAGSVPHGIDQEKGKGPGMD